MSDSGSKNSLSWGDTLFLHIERPGQPLNIACVSIFDGEIKFDDCIAHIESRLPLIPRYRQRVVFRPFDLGLPTWEVDPRFDLRNHVSEVKLRRGTEQELKTLAGRIGSKSLDRRHPLWNFTLTRLEDGRTAILVRIHHSMADGIAGVGLINAIMDSEPTPPPVSHPLPHHDPPPAEDSMSTFLKGMAKSYLSFVEGALTLHSGLLGIAEQAVAGSAVAPAEMLNFLSELASPAEPLPFNIVCQGPQKFSWTELPLQEIKAIKNACGGTVNDVVLTTVATAFGHYAKARGVDLKGRSLRVVIPVNVRGGSSDALGNQISFVPVPIPLDVRDPKKLLAVVRERVEFLKHAHAAELVGLFGGLLSTLPNAFWAKVGPIASQLPLSLCNTICTNVPGPQVPLYLLGRKMVSWYPWVPIGGLMGLNCAVLTYNGTAFFGFTGDVHAAPDLQLLEKFLNHSFDKLKSAASAGAAVVNKPKPQPHKQNARVERAPSQLYRSSANQSHAPARKVRSLRRRLRNPNQHSR
jgi:diacylglycerol O-acyltransferase